MVVTTTYKGTDRYSKQLIRKQLSYGIVVVVCKALVDINSMESVLTSTVLALNVEYATQRTSKKGMETVINGISQKKHRRVLSIWSPS